MDVQYRHVWRWEAAFSLTGLSSSVNATLPLSILSVLGWDTLESTRPSAHTYTEMLEKEPLTQVTRLSHPPTYLMTEHIFHMESMARRQQKTISQVWQVLLRQALMSVLQKKKKKKERKEKKRKDKIKGRKPLWLQILNLMCTKKKILRSQSMPMDLQKKKKTENFCFIGLFLLITFFRHFFCFS